MRYFAHFLTQFSPSFIISLLKTVEHFRLLNVQTCTKHFPCIHLITFKYHKSSRLSRLELQCSLLLQGIFLCFSHNRKKKNYDKIKSIPDASPLHHWGKQIDYNWAQNNWIIMSKVRMSYKSVGFIAVFFQTCALIHCQGYTIYYSVR